MCPKEDLKKRERLNVEGASGAFDVERQATMA
jgi:hypothetical protein